MKTAKTERLAHKAVKNEKPSTKQKILQKLFAVWFDAFVYNQIWEDPRVDLQALEINGDCRILTISSGGCNALNYLLAEPEKVTAVDLNRHHIFLLNLKIAALKFLQNHEDFFNFFGYGKSENNLENYKNFLEPNLDNETKKFWESSSFAGKLTNNKRIDFFQTGGLYEHSRNGYFLRFFHKFARLFGCRPEEVLNAKTPDEQERLFQKHIAPFFDSFVIKIIGKMPVTMFGLGIPPQQFDELKNDSEDGANIIEIYKNRVKKLAVEFPIYENYFAWQAFGRKYDTENRQAVPEYLKAENYEKLKSNAEKIETKIGSVTEEIKQNDFGKFNRFVFLDAQDWMNADALIELWQTIADKSESGARIIFRTAGANSPIEKNLPNDLRKKFIYEKEFSQELFKQDRASIYGGFHLYILK